MRILVIGGTAFIGPDVVTRLRIMQHTVALFHRGLTEAALPPDVTHIHGERHRLADFAGEFSRFDPEVVLDMIPTTEYEAQAVMSIFMGIARRVVAISSIDVYRAYGRLHGTEPGPVEPGPPAGQPGASTTWAKRAPSRWLSGCASLGASWGGTVMSLRYREAACPRTW